VLLVGFMGSGKSSVGRALADLLQWEFVDFDEAIVEEVGLSISEIFRVHGEGRFRDLEAVVGAQLLSRNEVVLAVGGGWAAQSGRLKDLPAGTLSVWLQVSPETAVRRNRGSLVGRPLLDTPDPVRTATRLMRAREVHYRAAALFLDSESEGIEALAKGIAARIKGSEAESG
jgi:shikimate kinase